MIAFLKKHLLVTVAVLAAPGVVLLGLSFLTFNFPCEEAVEQFKGEAYSYTRCGLGALQWLRPLISEIGIYGGSGWLKWTIHILAVTGPLFASLLILRSQLSLRRRESPEGTVEIALAVDRTRMLFLLATLSIFLTVVVYKAAG